MPPAIAYPKKTDIVGCRPGAPLEVGANQNLCDLFLHELSAFLSGADNIMTTASDIYEWLPSRQTALREMAENVVKNARDCIKEISSTLQRENLVLVRGANTAVEALTMTLSSRECDNIAEPWSVTGTRLISVFRKASLQLEVQAEEAAEYAFLLGFENLHSVLCACAAKWADCAHDLRMKKSSFCAEAYIADVKVPGTAQKFA